MDRYEIDVSDPWDLVTDVGSGPFTGQATDEAEGRLLIHLDEPISRNGTAFVTIHCQRRHAGSDPWPGAGSRSAMHGYLLAAKVERMSDLVGTKAATEPLIGGIRRLS
jgi:hypothetical protein